MINNIEFGELPQLQSICLGSTRSWLWFLAHAHTQTNFVHVVRCWEYYWIFINFTNDTIPNNQAWERKKKEKENYKYLNDFPDLYHHFFFFLKRTILYFLHVFGITGKPHVHSARESKKMLSLCSQATHRSAPLSVPCGRKQQNTRARILSTVLPCV